MGLWKGPDHSEEQANTFSIVRLEKYGPEVNSFIQF